MASSPVRRAFFQLAGSVVAVDVVAIAAYYATDVGHAGPRTRTIFTAVWVALTFGVVLVGLRRMRQARGIGTRSARR
ncbi:MAG TPA: hypothetical protein VFE05_15970 [Longimicrobiaceae bacterium]|jgi:hypothetical protein|nr:hypothetical protein [Longimicrobiaceae bacterium]